jgi:hypothetical protein
LTSSSPVYVNADSTRSLTFGNGAAIGNTDRILAAVASDSNRAYSGRLSNLTFARVSDSNHGPWSIDMTAVGSSPKNIDNLWLARIQSSRELVLYAQNIFWFGGVLKNSTTNAPIPVSSLSLDRTVATAVSYTPATGTALATSTIFMMSIQLNDADVATAPGGIGFNMASTVSNGYPGGTAGVNSTRWSRVVGNPNNIVSVCAGEDLRAFAIDDTGSLWICNNITQGRVGTTGLPSTWIRIPGPRDIQFSQVYYRQSTLNIAYAIDTQGRVYVERDVNGLFNAYFPRVMS